MQRLAASLALAAATLVLAACSSSAPTPADPTTAPSTSAGNGDAPIVIARDLAFTTTELEVPAGQEFSLVFDNQEGPPHNVAIYTDESASQQVFVGEIFSGPATRTYSVPALAPGSYFFRCDVHPSMQGTVVAQ
ncbi:MAG TPA: cupredoxin domain-containing protein [Candidatus Limnocylindrales bacterium]|nr:cupredoxin domain-containing protein [Candidatus Limnocylindrales bacterium]